jgi:ribulose-phosphate 3-epimerase
MRVKIAPSLLSADFANLTKSVREAVDGGADALHFDIMDGHFVPNITFGPLVVKALRPLTTLPFLVHLMIENPELYIEEFVKAGADAVTVHVETCPHLHRTVQQIKSLGVAAGVTVNPATPLDHIPYVAGDIDSILIMTVNPGFGGQEFIEATLPKITEARQIADKSGRSIEIEVDGGVDVNTSRRVVDAGATLLIAGSAVFGHNSGETTAIRELREAVELV